MEEKIIKRSLEAPESVWKEFKELCRSEGRKQGFMFQLLIKNYKETTKG